MDIYRAHGAGWSLWTYKDIGLQGLVYAHPESPYLTRIEDVLAAKRRLGVDLWGRRQFIAGLVRHILLAEPMVDRFAQAFAGVTPDDAAVLAASFRFENCVERTELSAVLRENAYPGRGDVTVH